MINRDIAPSVHSRLADEKAIILLGPRQVGKSTLLKQLAPAFRQKVVEWSGDDADVRTLLANPTATLLRQYIGAAKTLVIDEAQRIENIGLCIKLIVDQIPGVKVIATGSFAFDLANRINEPLTGRKWEYRLYPFSFGEMVNHHGFMEENRLLNHRLIYGYYPEIVNNPGEEEVRLKQLSSSYLYKDILTGNAYKSQTKWNGSFRRWLFS